MERLTKKNPGTNLERLLNFAIAKDKQVVLDYGFEKKPLVQVVVEKAKEIGCDASEQAVMWEGQCMECDCAVALMNMLAVQAAELHARLSKIEDILGDDYDLDRLAAIMNQRMSMREDVAERWKLTSDIPIDRLRELAQADGDGRCVVLPAGGFSDQDGENALKSAMNTCYYHNNPVTRFIADAVAEKLVRAEAALKERDHDE